MKVEINELILTALRQPRDAVFATMSRLLADAFPDKVLLETEDHLFNLQEFAWDEKCGIRTREGIHQEWTHTWDDGHGRVAAWPYNTWAEVDWSSHRLQVVTIGSYGQYCRDLRHFVLADTAKVAQEFLAAVCSWCGDVRGEILVFSDGRWSKSTDLFESIRHTTLESLVLASNLREQIEADFLQFFECKDTYRRYGIPWKRGILFLGPPGNGKTHALKGLINLIGKPCLYVRSFTSEYQSDQQNMSAVFSRARASAPCLIVLEDLDSLITNENRAFFLNELDGFHSNEGLLTVATTNHPDRLDPAILDRPSRFDRKYTFELPEVGERWRYLRAFSERLDRDLRLSDEGIGAVSEATEGFSFAYLKELFLSAMMQWVSLPGERPMDTLMLAQVEILREQMATTAEMAEPFDVEGDDPAIAMLPPGMRAMARRQFRRFRR